ncbi:MAG: NUDIX hydrolase [Bifidobacteriaceae bacterium]|nr:NUDIX hydrolase [Bifidobacteriaceae bacterium]
MPNAPKIPPSAACLAVTVDVVALTVRERRLTALLITRLLPPFAGSNALPGGFVLRGETPREAALRELAEETGLAPPGHLEQLGTYGPLDRDPRADVLSVAYLLLAPAWNTPAPGGDSEAAAWVDVRSAHGLAFDHGRILADGVTRARAKLEYTALALAFVPPEFTMAQLRSVYEAVWDTTLDPRNFSRKVLGSSIVEATGKTVAGGTGRPAAIYRARPGLDPARAVLFPPILRPA